MSRTRTRTPAGPRRRIRIGCGAGFADDRVDPAVELAEHGRLDYLVFECLAERTVALAQLDRLRDPDAGYNEWLEERMEAVLEPCVRHGTRVITNMGAANPTAAARVVAEVAHRLGLDGLRIATVTGDDVLHLVKGTPSPSWTAPTGHSRRTTWATPSYRRTPTSAHPPSPRPSPRAPTWW